jgi:hypothetical protein
MEEEARLVIENLLARTCIRLTSTEYPYAAPCLFSIPTVKKMLKIILQWVTEMSDPFSVQSPCYSKYRAASATTQTIDVRERERERAGRSRVSPSPPCSRPGLAVPSLLPSRAHRDLDLQQCCREGRKGTAVASSTASAGRAR